MQQLIGNEETLSLLRQQAQRGHLGHGYLLHGQPGSGVRTLARYLAQLCLCEGEMPPCGRCRHCVKMQKNIHPDVQVIAPAEGKASISVEQMKALRQDLYVAPNEAVRKVYIIEDAHKMTVAAQNALLKSLEEPPEYVTMILCTPAKDLLLPVILSRTAHIAMAPVSEQQMMEVLHLRCPDCSQKELQTAVALSGGAVGKALYVLRHPEYLATIDRCMAWLSALVRQDRVEAAVFVQWLEKQKGDTTGLFEVLRQLLCDLMRCKQGCSVTLVHKQQEMAELCADMTMPALMHMYEQIGRAQRRLEGNANFALTMGVLAQDCWEEIH